MRRGRSPPGEAPALAAPPSPVVTPMTPAAPRPPALPLAQALAAGWLAGSACGPRPGALEDLAVRATPPSRGTGARRSLASEALDVARAMGFARAPRVVFVPGVVSPLLFSLPGRAARIVFPSDLWSRLDPDARRMILAHEIAHWRRRDHWVRWLELAATVLYWWHPAVWFARREVRRTEDACSDAWVVDAYPGPPAPMDRRSSRPSTSSPAPGRPRSFPGSGIGATGGMKRRTDADLRGRGAEGPVARRLGARPRRRGGAALFAGVGRGGRRPEEGAGAGAGRGRPERGAAAGARMRKRRARPATSPPGRSPCDGSSGSSRATTTCRSRSTRFPPGSSTGKWCWQPRSRAPAGRRSNRSSRRTGSPSSARPYRTARLS